MKNLQIEVCGSDDISVFTPQHHAIFVIDDAVDVEFQVIQNPSITAHED